MRRRDVGDVWGKGYAIDSLASAMTFVESVWDDELPAPLRIHDRTPDHFGPGMLRRFGQALALGYPSQERDPGGGSRLGSPRMTRAMMTRLDCDPNETHIVRTGFTHDGKFMREEPDREFYTRPLYRALHILDGRSHDRWTKTLPARPFHPHVTTVLRAMAAYDFRPEWHSLLYTDGTRVPPDMAELFAIAAARKLRGVYHIEPMAWTVKSESQRAAEDEMPAA